MALAGTDLVKTLFDTLWRKETIDLCRIITERKGEDINPNILQARDYVLNLATEFNANQNSLRFGSFQWVQHKSGATTFDPSDDDILASAFYLFGLRLGADNARYKVAVICHLDTVPADEASEEWQPFVPFVEMRDYPTGTTTPQEFLVGRGCVDDKGPAMSAFAVARALALKHDGPGSKSSGAAYGAQGAPYGGRPSSIFESGDVALEVLFDTSEETSMATPYYMEDPQTCPPHFGIVNDAFWCTRAEKGGERPRFLAPAFVADEPDTGKPYIADMKTNPENSSNTIPDWAEATIRASDPTVLAAYAEAVQDAYNSFEFDTADYKRAELLVRPSSDGSTLTLRTLVEGAQHGSSPEENREAGANPFVSLANFMAGQLADGTLAQYSGAGVLCTFIAWAWGTLVFGEKHEPLYAFDDIFVEGNGTTYAISKMQTVEQDEQDGGKQQQMQFEIDIRYALSHHSGEWDGATEGFVHPELPSKFATVFPQLVAEFNAAHPSLADVSVIPSTLFAPDIRLPETNASFQKVMQAYQDVRGEEAPLLAIGGGTDAKGFTNLLAVGPLFSTKMGPPVNYHGINEGAPTVDMALSTAILYRIMELEVENPPRDMTLMVRRLALALKHFKMMRAKGFKHCCDH